MSIISYKCLTCGANLRYSPKRKKWHCKYCGNDYNIQELNNEYGTNELDINKKGKYDCYKCSNCGAELITSLNTAATFCSYCNSSEIIKSRLNAEYKPDKIIPFKITKQQAISTYTDLAKKSLFAPDEFNNMNNITMIKGMYIPCYLFDCDVTSDIIANARKINSVKKANDIYKIRRKLTVRFKNIPVDGSSKFPNSLMNTLEPFKYEEMVDFTPKYISGFFAERFDVVSRATSKEIEERAIKSVDNNFLNLLVENERKYSQRHGGTLYDEYININDNTKVIENSIKSKYVLVPIWLLTIAHKNKLYSFAINRTNWENCWEYSNG